MKKLLITISFVLLLFLLFLCGCEERPKRVLTLSYRMSPKPYSVPSYFIEYETVCYCGQLMEVRGSMLDNDFEFHGNEFVLTCTGCHRRYHIKIDFDDSRQN